MSVEIVGMAGAREAAGSRGFPDGPQVRAGRARVHTPQHGSVPAATGQAPLAAVTSKNP